MILKNRLFTPGPTPLLPAAQLAMAGATMHHRTAEFRKLYTKVLADLKTFVGTNNDVVLFTASGTGAMEAAVSNLTSNPSASTVSATVSALREVSAAAGSLLSAIGTKCPSISASASPGM